MIKKLRGALLSLAALFAVAVPFAVPAVVSADASIQGNLCSGADNLTLDTTTGQCVISGQTSCDFNCILGKIINIFSVIVGVVAVIMIIVGGFRYITSGGASEKVTGAKNTLLYAIIGLIIVALAQIIVRFVLQKTTTA